jgi:fluoride ion exporter CrcB/FEX
MRKCSLKALNTYLMVLISTFSALIFEHVSLLEQTRWATIGANTLFVRPLIFLNVMSVIFNFDYVD